MVGSDVLDGVIDWRCTFEYDQALVNQLVVCAGIVDTIAAVRWMLAVLVTLSSLCSFFPL